MIFLLTVLCIIGWAIAVLAVGVLWVLHDPLDWWHAKLDYKNAEKPSSTTAESWLAKQ